MLHSDLEDPRITLRKINHRIETIIPIYLTYFILVSCHWFVWVSRRSTFAIKTTANNLLTTLAILRRQSTNGSRTRPSRTSVYLICFDPGQSGGHCRVSSDQHTRSTYLWIERIDWSPSGTALSKSLTKNRPRKIRRAIVWI
jgi:hypothetical protein